MPPSASKGGYPGECTSLPYTVPSERMAMPRHAPYLPYRVGEHTRVPRTQVMRERAAVPPLRLNGVYYPGECSSLPYSVPSEKVAMPMHAPYLFYQIRTTPS